MSDIKTAFGSNGQALTITLASLAASSTVGRESTAVDNSSNKFLDALVSGKFKLASGGSISEPKAVLVYAYATVDGGTSYSDAATGTDAAITLDAPPNLKLLGAVYYSAVNQSHKGGPWSVAALFGGKLPEKWGIVILNNTGKAFSATGGDHVLQYQGVYATIT